MGCTPAPACKAALSEALRRWPNRNVASDGICASPRHTQQNPTSDHEVGNAFDLTDDPTSGCHAHLLVASAVARHDKRIKYAISQGRIARSYDKPGIAAWTWSKYTGSNPHTKHAHVSIKAEFRNDTSPWFPTKVAPDNAPQEVDELTADEREAVLTANHFVKVIWPQYAPKIDQILQHLEVLMKGAPAMGIRPVPQVLFEVAEKHGIDV